jgi:putative acetyltransferase
MEGIGLNESDERPAMAHFVRRNRGFSLVATSRGAVVGAVLCGHDGRRGYLHHLAVRPDWRRHGLGRKMVESCLRRLAAAGVQKCNIFLFADNARGEAFWRRIGWSARCDLKVLQRPTRGRLRAADPGC